MQPVFSQRVDLVDDERAYLREALQRVSVLDQYACLGSAPKEQAMISTETAEMVAKTMLGLGPKTAQTIKAAMAFSTIASTKQNETQSAIHWVDPRLRYALATISTICDSTMLAPTLSVRMIREPFLLSVLPVTLSPSTFSTGTSSPVAIDSSTE